MATYHQRKSFVSSGKYDQGIRHNVRLSVTPSGNRVTVDLTCDCRHTKSPPGAGVEADYTTYWIMRLQRYNSSSKTWKTIGTREGYVSRKSPSNRVFTSIKKQNASLRVRVTLYENKTTVYHQLLGSINSTSWMY